MRSFFYLKGDIMIPIIATFVLLAVVILGVIKKFNLVALFCAVSLGSLMIYSVVTGKSVIGDATTGNVVLDVFEYMFNTMKTQFSGTVMVSATILAYMGFMNKIGASQAFTVLLAKPLMKIKQPYILLGAIIIIENFVKLVIPSAISCVALLFAILYPIFLAVGCSNAAICCAFSLGTCITWGPADAGVSLTASFVGNIGVADFFMDYQFVVCIVEMVVMAIVFIIVSIFADRKAAKAGPQAEVTEDMLKKQAETLTVKTPGYYPILPMLPLLFILLFSGKILPIRMNTVACALLTLFVAFIIYLLGDVKNFKTRLEDIGAFTTEYGNFVGRMGFIVVGGNLFAGAINTIGGLTMIIKSLNAEGGGLVPLTVIGVVLALLCVGATGTYTANLNVFVPYMISVATVTGVSIPVMAQIGNMACGLPSAIAAVAGTNLLLMGETGTEYPTFFKRNIIPVLAAAATGVIFNFLFRL